jgi:hypothetical protein
MGPVQSERVFTVSLGPPAALKTGFLAPRGR